MKKLKHSSIKSVNHSALLMIVLTGSHVSAAQAPKSWYQTEETLGLEKSLHPFSEPDLEFVQEVDELYTVQGDSYDRLLDESKFSDKRGSTWELTQIRSQLALTSSGTIGILALQGGIAAELRWFRKDRMIPFADPKDEDEAISDQEPIDASFHHDMSEAEINDTIEKIADTAYLSGKVRNKNKMMVGLKKAITKTQKMISGAQSRENSLWYPYLFRFRVVFGGSGIPIEGLNVGGDFMVRFEWKIPPNSNNAAPGETMNGNLESSSFSRLVADLSKDIEVFSERDPFGSRWQVKNFQILIGQSTGGTIGIAKMGATYLGRLYFQRRTSPLREILISADAKKNFDNETLTMLVQDNTTKSKKPKNKSVKIKRNKFRRGLRKAEKIASFFIKRANRNRQRLWRLKVVRTDFNLGLGGSLGLATLNGFGELRVEYIDKSW